MNVHGSYRKLLAHSKSAVISSIEIYNKPKFEYREEILAVLLSTAWELIFFAILSKNKHRIFEKKKKGQQYKTLDFGSTIKAVKKYIPHSMSVSAIIKNIHLIREYRNTAVHYHHESQHKHAIYVLAQASVQNYRDLLLNIFKQDIADEVNIFLLPLSFNETPDFIKFFKSEESTKYSPFISRLFDSLNDLEKTGNIDTTRLITRCAIKIESTHSIKSADLVVGKNKNGGKITLEAINNPDHSYPFLQSEIIGIKNKPKHRNLKWNMTSYVFQAVIWKYGLKRNPEYCWVTNKTGHTARYTYRTILFLNSLSIEDIDVAQKEYRVFIQAKRKQSNKPVPIPNR